MHCLVRKGLKAWAIIEWTVVWQLTLDAMPVHALSEVIPHACNVPCTGQPCVEVCLAVRLFAFPLQHAAHMLFMILGGHS